MEEKKSRIVGLSKIEPISNGNGGMKLEYDKIEQDKVTYLNTFKAVHRKPVSGEFKGLWNVLKGHSREVFRLGEGVEDIDITIKSIKRDHDFGYRLSVNVSTASDSSFCNEYSSCIINEGNYSGHGDLELLFNQLEEYVVKYVKSKTSVDTQQVLIDFRTEQEKKGKNTDNLSDIEGMSEEERMNEYIKFLESKGSIFLEYGIKGEA